MQGTGNSENKSLFPVLCKDGFPEPKVTMNFICLAAIFEELLTSLDANAPDKLTLLIKQLLMAGKEDFA